MFRSPHDDLLLAYRVAALGFLVGGLLAIPGALNAPGFSDLARGSALVLGAAISVVGAGLTVRPDRLRRIVHGRPEFVVPGLFIASFAVNAVYGIEYGPLFFFSAVAITVGASLLPGQGWLTYSLAAVVVNFALLFLTGQSGELAENENVAWVAIAFPANFVAGAYVGKTFMRIAVRMRRLGLLASREREHLVRLRGEHLPALERHTGEATAIRAAMSALAEDAPAPRREALLSAVARSELAQRRLESSVSPDAGGLAGDSTSWMLLDSARTALGARVVIERFTVASELERLSLPAIRALQEVLAQTIANASRTATFRELRVDLRPEGLGLIAEIYTGPEDDRPGSGEAAAPSGGGGLGGSLARDAVEAVSPGSSFRWGPSPGGSGWIARAHLSGLHHDQPAARADDVPSTDHVRQVTLWTSQALRALRWAGAVTMIGVSALDLDERQVTATLIAVGATAGVEFFMRRAGMRGEDRTDDSMVWAALAIALLASAALPQGGHYQSTGFAAAVMVEVAWRKGLRAWVAVELARIAVILATIYVPDENVLRALSAQVLFPVACGLAAAAAHRLVSRTAAAQQDVGTQAERSAVLAQVARNLSVRHELFGALSDALATPTSAQEHDLADQLADLRSRMTNLGTDIDRCYDVSDELEDAVIAAFKSVLEVPVYTLNFFAIPRLNTNYTGAAIRLYGARARLLDELSFAAEHFIRPAVPATAFGKPQLRSVHVTARPLDDTAAVRLDITTTPRHQSTERLMRNHTVRASGGISVTPMPQHVTITISEGSRI
ncbi:hypothetical protein GKE82_24315 [Conexibacter sp. W3-3-2]|uniref:hypothetical protein n=1 Tax=Conexibacter sp. W3-3-2 TaxID=2675227 RepID=UPI0012B89E14|nr:hypothetical protein [Conexibacter sp. W3-3-2]MTD47334.1 hypothetical protein [Conexibacter sp. W3-3-2]